jgi:hypothetical protein
VYLRASVVIFLRVAADLITSEQGVGVVSKGEGGEKEMDNKHYV